MLLGTLGSLSGGLWAVTPYTFKPVQVFGGGYVDGIVFHPGQANLVYARTDMGGVYRWNAATSAWIPLTDFLNRDQADYMGNLALALDPNNVNKVYVMCGKYTASWAGNGALLSSNDQGSTWTITNLPFKVGGNEDGRGAGERMAVDPNLGTILFAGSNNSGFYKSINSGTAWTLVGSFPGTNITFVTFDKASGSTGVVTPTLYVGVNATTNNLYRSTDGGATWALVPGQPTGTIPLRAAWGNGGRLYVTYANAVGPNGITAGVAYRLDAGTTWTNLNPPTGQGGWCGVGVFPGATDQVLLATMDRWWPADEIYHSTNNGGTWVAKLTGATMVETSAPWVASGTPHWVSAVEVDPFNANQAFWVTGYGVYRTTNLAAALPTWTFASAGIEQTVPLQLISPPAGANLLTAMGDVDGFRHNNLDAPPANRHLPEVGTTLAIAYAEALPTKMIKAYNSGAPNNYGAYSTDGGSNWIAFPAFPAGTTGAVARGIAISPDGNNIVWAPAGAACSRSTNNGATWVAVTGGIPAGLEMVADRINSNKFYAFDWNTGQMWISTNGGASFAVGATGLGVLPSYQANDASLKATLGIEGDLWLCTGANGLWHSTNSGTTFAKLGTATVAYEIATGKSVAAGYPALYLFGTVGGVRGFYRSDDTGATWTRINDDQHQYGWTHDFSGDPRIYGRVYLCAEGRGALYGDIPAVGTPTFTATRTVTATSTRTPTATSTPTVAAATATPTLTVTATSSRTSSPTSTSTVVGNTATSTFTVSSTSSSTFTSTPSRSPTGTFTQTAVAATPTSTSTPTASRTISATSSTTASSTSSVTPSFSASATASRTASNTATLSVTGSQTRTVTVSPTITATYTDVPPGSTFTFTASVTTTHSFTASTTPSFSATATSSPSPSSSATPSASRTATASSTASATSTPSSTASPSSTFTVSVSPSASPTFTESATTTAGPSPTSTATPTASASSTVTMPATFTATLTASPTLTSSVSESATVTSLATGTSTSTTTPTVSQTSTATVTVVVLASSTSTVTPLIPATPVNTPVGEQGLSILDAKPLPNPNPVALALQLSAAADEVTVKVWSPALRLLASETTVNVAAGWSVVALPAGFVKGAANGGYFYTISAASKGRKALPKAPGKFLILK